MQQSMRAECPQCGRPLERFNGHIGYCSYHKRWVSPTKEYDNEAQLANDKEREEKRKYCPRCHNRLEIIKEHIGKCPQCRWVSLEQGLEYAQEAEEENRKELAREKWERMRKVIFAVLAAAIAIGAAVFFLIIRPVLNYEDATRQFIAGEYQASKNGYTALGGYKDSAARALLCDAMIDLQEKRPEDAVSKLDQLTSDGQEDIAKQLADALLPVVADWRAKGLTPQALLLLLGKTELIDPDNKLDIAKLTEEGHIALLDGRQLATYTDDVNDDGTPELIVLNPDYSVTVYRMAEDSNVRMVVDNEITAACEMRFGNGYKDTNESASIACFSEAYRLLPNDETRASITVAYQLRSASYENAGNMDAAIADARSAMEIAGTEDAFAYFYEINLRHAQNGQNAADAITIWDAFAAGSVAELTRFSAKERWQADAAQLHIARSAELAAKKDEACIAELRIAAELGADVTGAMAEAEAHFEPGLSLARLRLMEIDLLGANAEKEQQIRVQMAEEVRLAISEWKYRGIDSADIPVLIHLADDQAIDLNGINREAIYEEAAVAVAGSVVQYSFVNWNKDDYKELLTLDASGELSLYGLDESWEIVSSVNTRLPGSSFNIADENAPLILILSSGKDEFLAVTGTSGKLSPLFRETGISRYKVDGSTITFSRLLEGSIARYNDYTYEAVGTTNRPVRTGIDWQQNDYPQPANATAAVQRYFEARAYDIPEEAALLTGESSVADFFTAAFLNDLPVPNVPGTVNAAAYLTQDGQELFEVTYDSGAQSVRTWVSAEYINGWKLTGAADTYGLGLATNSIDFAISLLSLNEEKTNTISTRAGRNTYRLLVPSAGRIKLIWQSGTKAAARTSHIVTMFRGSLTGESVFSFELQPSPNKQQSKDMFVSAGVYYVTVEASIANAEAYHLTIVYDAETHVELENNDTYQKATQMELNTGYSGALSSNKDVDYFSFTLDENSAVNVTFGHPGNSGKSTTHTLTVYSAADGSTLSTVSVPGNAQLSETGNLYLSSGTYLVQVAKGTTSTDDEYILTVSVDQNGVMESEPNNTPETANAVPVNEDIHASIGQEGDIDCFAFILEEDAILQPRFTFTPTDSASRTYVLTVTDRSHQEMLKVNIGGKESTKIITPVALPAGTYTVKIENPRFVRQDYTLRIISQTVESAEQEPNDTLALATNLMVGQARTGILSTDTDVDYYRMTFDEQTTVSLAFSFPQSTSRETAFTVTVEQNGKIAATWYVKGDSGGFEETLAFMPGTYYLRVKPSTWLGALYTIELQSE